MRSKGTFFDYETYQKGYEYFVPTKQAVKENKGKYVVYLTKGGYDPNRGYMNIKSGVLCERRYNQIFMDDYGSQVDYRDILEMAIKL